MAEASISRSLDTRDVERSFQDSFASKPDSEQAFRFGVYDNPATSLEQSWAGRCARRLSTRYPRTYVQITRFLKYWRGPRPKINLSEPTSWLDIDFALLEWRVRFPLESFSSRLFQPFTHPWLLLILGVAYIIGFAFFSRAQAFLTPADSFIGCTSTFWLLNDGCGLDGQLCATFSNSTFDFRCPAQCDNVILQNWRIVGGREIGFQPLIVGGGDDLQTYRGDSLICAAAIQAGRISNSKGGCASLQLTGNFTDFLPTTANGLTSIGFPSVFPLSFRFGDSTSLTRCVDYRDSALAFNVVITWILFAFLRPRPLVLYWCLVCIGFWHISLFSQPQRSPPPISLAFGTFLPVLFVAYAFWRLAFRFTLPSFSKIPLEGAVWYLGPFWVGVLANLTTERIPISRLTAGDLSQRSGAIAALVIILIVVAILAINQVRVIRKTGWFPHYLGWYILGGLIVLVIALLPGLQLRVHHYITAMVLIPGTAFPTRLSALYQGLLLGLFLNGTAAFGFDSILQTAVELRRDGTQGSDLPAFLTNSTTYNASIAFANQTVQWAGLTGEWEGFSLLVDDVQRYYGTALNFSLASLDPTLPHFFRLAYTYRSESGDFTKPATLWPNGTWVDPRPGST